MKNAGGGSFVQGRRKDCVQLNLGWDLGGGGGGAALLGEYRILAGLLGDARGRRSASRSIKGGA